MRIDIILYTPLFTISMVENKHRNFTISIELRRIWSCVNSGRVTDYAGNNFFIILIFPYHFYRLIYGCLACIGAQAINRTMADATLWGRTVSTVVSLRSDPRCALADEMPRLCRLITVDRRSLARPFHPGVGRRIQIGTADRCSAHQQHQQHRHQSTESIQATPRFTADLVYSADLCLHAAPLTTSV